MLALTVIHNECVLMYRGLLKAFKLYFVLLSTKLWISNIHSVSKHDETKHLHNVELESGLILVVKSIHGKI